MVQREGPGDRLDAQDLPACIDRSVHQHQKIHVAPRVSFVPGRGAEQPQRSHAEPFQVRAVCLQQCHDLVQRGAGVAINLSPSGPLTNQHSLIAAETFTVDAVQNINLDLKALLREDLGGGYYIVEIDRISAGDSANVLLQASLEQSGAGASGGVLVKAPSQAAGITHYNFFRPDSGLPEELSRGVFGTGNTPIASTYDFRGIDPATGNRTLPGLQAGAERLRDLPPGGGERSR